MRPSLLAGKSVFVEWPLDRNLPIAREMLSLSQTNGSKTIMGLQGSFSPVIRKMKEIVGSGEIGKGAWKYDYGEFGEWRYDREEEC